MCVGQFVWRYPNLRFYNRAWLKMFNNNKKYYCPCGGRFTYQVYISVVIEFLSSFQAYGNFDCCSGNIDVGKFV